jgi:hypothetical protein
MAGDNTGQMAGAAVAASTAHDGRESWRRINAALTAKRIFALSVRCPVCRVAEGRHCLRGDGRDMIRVHTWRLLLARNDPYVLGWVHQRNAGRVSDCPDSASADEWLAGFTEARCDGVGPPADRSIT